MWPAMRDLKRKLSASPGDPDTECRTCSYMGKCAPHDRCAVYQIVVGPQGEEVVLGWKPEPLAGLDGVREPR